MAKLLDGLTCHLGWGIDSAKVALCSVGFWVNGTGSVPENLGFCLDFFLHECHWVEPNQ